ncbi:MAG TPA: hypothetical protein VMG12_05965 [Polyangiaceae bacterium]|nr:hypothetical protein [Polyangiaceae bacterium]
MPGGTAAWSKLGEAVAGWLRGLTSAWRTSGWTPLESLDAMPTLLLDARVNGQACAIPTRRDALGRCDEIAAAAALVNLAGGLDALLVSTRMSAAQVWLAGCSTAQAPARVAAAAGQLLQIGMDASPERCMPLGCIPAIEVHDHGGGALGVSLYTECDDALGPRAIESAARAMAAPLANLVGCDSAPTIQVGHVEALRARVRCRVDVERLLAAAAPGELVEAGLRGVCDEVLSWFGVDRHQPELAAAHNSYVLEGASAAAEALGLEPWRFVASAESHAARWGSCEPLVRWRRHRGELHGQLELPVDLESAARALPPFVGDDNARREVARRRVQLVAGVALLASASYLRAVLSGSVRQRATDAGEPLSLESRSEGRLARDSAIAESGVRPIAPAYGRSRSRTG